MAAGETGNDTLADYTVAGVIPSPFRYGDMCDIRFPETFRARGTDTPNPVVHRRGFLAEIRQILIGTGLGWEGFRDPDGQISQNMVAVSESGSQVFVLSARIKHVERTMVDIGHGSGDLRRADVVIVTLAHGPGTESPCDGIGFLIQVIRLECGGDRFQIRFRAGNFGSDLRLDEVRNGNSGKNPDHCDYDEQFNQGERRQTAGPPK